MSNKSKKVASIIGIIVGLAIIAVGIVVLDNAKFGFSSVRKDWNSLSFGGDYYTHMSTVTNKIGNAINENTWALHTIGGALSDIIKCIGWLIISLGATDVCFFGYKLASVCNKTRNKYVEPEVEYNEES